MSVFSVIHPGVPVSNCGFKPLDTNEFERTIESNWGWDFNEVQTAVKSWTADVLRRRNSAYESRWQAVLPPAVERVLPECSARGYDAFAVNMGIRSVFTRWGFEP